jgi:hypothetical protein
MNRTLLSSLAVAGTLSLLVVGCGESDPALDSGEVDEAGGKADGLTLPAGTYQASTPKLGEIRELTLNDDHTFSRAIQVVDCVPQIGCGPQTGTYKFTRSGSTHYVRFYDDGGDVVDRYEWKLSGSELQVRFNFQGQKTTRWTHLAAQASSDGQFCGGFAGIQCPTGQTCQLDGNYPDAGGHCVGDLSGRPQICGGIAGLQCPAGQTCQLDGN